MPIKLPPFVRLGSVLSQRQLKFLQWGMAELCAKPFASYPPAMTDETKRDLKQFFTDMKALVDKEVKP